MENLKLYREKMNKTLKDGTLTLSMARENGREHYDTPKCKATPSKSLRIFFTEQLGDPKILLFLIY